MNQKFRRLIPKVVVFCILFVILVFGTACETPHYNIKVEYDNSEGEVTGAGIYPKGETVTVTAIPETGYEFLYWFEGNTILSRKDHYSFEVSEDRILSANFAKTIQQFRVKFPFNLENMLRGSVEGGGVYEEGETVTVKATHNDGYGFVSWTEGNTILSRDSHYTFTITRDYNLKANFEKLKDSVRKLPDLHLRIVSVTTPIGKGYTATLQAETLPGAICDITVRYKSGPSQAQGLYQKTADSRGIVSWSWKVGTRTTPGSWPITVSVSHDGRSTSQTIYFEVY